RPPASDALGEVDGWRLPKREIRSGDHCDRRRALVELVSSSVRTRLVRSCCSRACRHNFRRGHVCSLLVVSVVMLFVTPLGPRVSCMTNGGRAGDLLSVSLVRRSGGRFRQAMRWLEIAIALVFGALNDPHHSTDVVVRWRADGRELMRSSAITYGEASRTL